MQMFLMINFLDMNVKFNEIYNQDTEDIGYSVL